MSTTTKYYAVTLLLEDTEDNDNTKTRTFNIPMAMQEPTIQEMRTRTMELITALATNATTGYGAQAIQTAFQETEKVDGETITYIPKGISKAELVTITEDVIYGSY